jgi:hypothetical protein
MALAHAAHRATPGMKHVVIQDKLFLPTFAKLPFSKGPFGGRINTKTWQNMSSGRRFRRH